MAMLAASVIVSFTLNHNGFLPKQLTGGQGLGPKESVTTAMASLDRFDRDRQKSIGRLIQTAKLAFKADDKIVAYVAVRQLGLLRANEAIPVLIDHFSFSPSLGSGLKPLPTSQALPCVFALGQIGSPSFDAVLTQVEDDGNFVTFASRAIVLRMSLSSEDAIGLLRRRADAEKNEKAANMLIRLADHIDKSERNSVYE